MRLDKALVDAGVFESRARAQAAIADGLVRVNGLAAKKAGQPVTATDTLTLVREPMRWVSRGALKLLAALDHFGIDPAGRTALDIGASTGGFSEVLLDRGAAHVTAIDVGHGQLHPRLAAERRLTSVEGLNVRDLATAGIAPADLIVADVSFISLTKALPPALALAPPGAELVALIKPQFELGPGRAAKGVVRQDTDHAAAIDLVVRFLVAAGWTVLGTTPSPIDGSDGNREFLVAARRP